MSSRSPFNHIELLGVKIDVITIAQAVSYIIDRAGRRDQPAGYVIKPYVEFLDRAARDPKLRALLNGAELSLADGVALTWAAHYLYAGPRTFRRFWFTLCDIVLKPGRLITPLPERTAGINFTWPLLEAADRAGRVVFLIGHPANGSIEHTRAVILKRLPNLKINVLDGRDPASRPGAVSDAWLTDTAATLRAANPDITLVGMGFPLQEQIMAKLAPNLSHGLLIGEGGTFDYAGFGGRRRKAPSLFQRTGTEWLWRLLLEPSRLRRQLAIPRFIRLIWRARKG
jgi:N-acetylglucosaminyldiphosphoundecaprenol N-acetyl-beta-D-mannosaminyltransferase